MRPFVRVKMLNSQDYKQLGELAKSRKLPTGKVKRVKIVLLSNQGYTAREITAELDCNERTALQRRRAEEEEAFAHPMVTGRQ